MRLIGIIAIAVLFAGAMTASAECSIVVEGNGNALVILAYEGNGTVKVPLPMDVAAPKVLNALYVDSPQGIELLLKEGEVATVVYMTSMLTEKKGGRWVIDTDLVAGDHRVHLSLPNSATIVKSEPQASISQGEESLDLVWEGPERIRIEYIFSQATSTSVTKTTTTTIADENEIGEEEVEDDEYITYVALLVGIILILGGAISIIFRHIRASQATEGMRKIMRTLGGNEYKVVDTLLKDKKGMRRSDLERTSSISKSSLALALNNLERKNIVDVDRSNTTHFVELTKWFKEL